MAQGPHIEWNAVSGPFVPNSSWNNKNLKTSIKTEGSIIIAPGLRKHERKSKEYHTWLLQHRWLRGVPG